MFSRELSVVISSTAETRREVISLRRHWRVAPDVRPNYFQDAHELFPHYWNQIETFSIFRFHFHNFPLESKWRFLLLFDFLRNINFHYLSTPRLSSAIEAEKGGCECHLDQFVDLDLDLCYLRSVWPGDGRENFKFHWFRHKSLSRANKATPPGGPTKALLSDVISCSKWRCRCWQSRWQSTVDNAEP